MATGKRHRQPLQIFYDILREASGNALLRSQLEALSARMAWLRGVTLARPERAAAAVKEETPARRDPGRRRQARPRIVRSASAHGGRSRRRGTAGARGAGTARPGIGSRAAGEEAEDGPVVTSRKYRCRSKARRSALTVALHGSPPEKRKATPKEWPKSGRKRPLARTSVIRPQPARSVKMAVRGFRRPPCRSVVPGRH